MQYHGWRIIGRCVSARWFRSPRPTCRWLEHDWENILWGGGYSTCNTYASWFKESWAAGIGWYYTTLIWIMSCLSVSHLSHCLLLLNPMREALISAKHYLLSKVWFDLTLKSSLELSTRRSIQWSSLRYLVSILALFFRLVFLYP